MMKKRYILLLMALFLAACTPLTLSSPSAPPETIVEPSPEGVAESAPTNERAQDDNEQVFRQLLPFDGIPPVYHPEFASAGDAPLQDEELIMGVVINGEAKAYPVSVLRFREIVDDELGGIPILVTW